jgi:hypothetical protein
MYLGYIKGGLSIGNYIKGGGATPPPVLTDFRMIVKTDNAGTSGSNQFTLPTASETYNYTVDWGDGVIENITVSTAQTHTYPSAGIYTISITGTFPRISFNNGGDRLKVLEVVNFGEVGWARLDLAFFGCANMKINPFATGLFTSITTMQRAFLNCTVNNFFPIINIPSAASFENTWSGNDLSNFPLIDVSSGTDFRATWRGNKLTSFPLLNMDNAVSLGSGTLNGAWQNNLLTEFPAINLPNGSDFSETWRNNQLASFPNVLLGTNKTNVVFTGTWRDNQLTSFPLLNMENAGNIRLAWANNQLTSFPLISFPNLTTAGDANGGAWQFNNLDTFPAISFPLCTLFRSAWQSNGIMSSFACRDFYKMTNGINAFVGTTLPTEDWSDILITQEANNINDNVTFHGGSSTYNVAGGVARAALVARGWIITDGGAE